MKLEDLAVGQIWEGLVRWELVEISPNTIIGARIKDGMKLNSTQELGLIHFMDGKNGLPKDWVLVKKAGCSKCK